MFDRLRHRIRLGLDFPMAESPATRKSDDLD
jgi:hypothetical protein